MRNYDNDLPPWGGGNDDWPPWWVQALDIYFWFGCGVGVLALVGLLTGVIPL